MRSKDEEVLISDIRKSYWNAIDANTRFQDENNYLKERVKKLEKVINKLLERISSLELELEKYEGYDLQRKIKWNNKTNERRFKKWKRYG